MATNRGKIWDCLKRFAIPTVSQRLCDVWIPYYLMSQARRLSATSGVRISVVCSPVAKPHSNLGRFKEVRGTLLLLTPLMISLPPCSPSPPSLIAQADHTSTNSYKNIVCDRRGFFSPLLSLPPEQQSRIVVANYELWSEIQLHG